LRLGRRFARLATSAVVRRPGLWPLLRRPLRRQFEQLAPVWDSGRVANHLAGFEAGLQVVPIEPRRALDLGSGTGDSAFALARRWPGVEVVGVDLAGAMVEEARRKTAPELSGRVRFEQADAAHLPFSDGAFDVVTLANMIPFFDELARVVAPGGYAVFGFSSGARTPIYVPPERLRTELERRGFADFREVDAGPGAAVVARKRGRD
jgi:ubiquinone/menaquinone biosynthesis C-methylase UbiE